MLRRLANLGCGKDDLVMTYVRQIRSICEFAVPYWGSMLTKEESRRIERVQRTALHVIMGESFIDYKNALLACGLERLDERRMKLIISFAKKTAKNPKFAHWFLQNKESDRKHRVPQTQYKTVHTRTKKFKRSSIPFMTDLLNCESMTKKEETISCQQCNLFFSTDANLHLHKRFKHIKDGIYPVWSNKVM